MKGVLLGLVLVLTVAPVANALLVELSLDGINPAPEAIDVVPDEVVAMYVISDSNGISYLRELSTLNSNPAAISNVQSYPAAGDIASITDLSGSLWSKFELEADDSADNILAGMHFSFDITIAPDAVPGTEGHIYLANPVSEDSIRLNVVPEPATVLLLGLGGVILLRRRKG